MDPFFCMRDVLSRAMERKGMLAAFAAGFLACAVLGAVFVNTPAGYDYHLRFAEKFLDRVCFSERNVILIFFERTAGHALLLALVLLGGIHIAALSVSVAVLFYRACTFGGSLVIFFTVYRMTGVLVVFTLYLPVHLLIDCILILAAALSCARAKRFRFCAGDVSLLLRDFHVLLALAATICLAEMILLLALFHPLGSII